MPGPRSFLAPPTRREITLLIFSLTVFVLSYNLETSLRMVGVSPAKLSSSYLGAVIKDPGFERDGRRPQAWRDDLEKLIAGEWTWEDGQIAGVERGEVGLVGSGTTQRTIYNAGNEKKAGRSAAKEEPGIGITQSVTVNEQFTRWEENIPNTKAIAHVPGYTVLDNVFIANGTFFLVTEDPDSLPRLSAIASSAINPAHPPRRQDWQILNPAQAVQTLGRFGGRIQQTTWLSTEPAEAQDPYTIFSLFRTHSYLAVAHSGSTVSSSGLHILSPDSANPGLGGMQNVPPPVRLWFPRIPTFSSPHVDPPEGNDKAHPPARTRSYTGFHPMLIKAAFPTVEIMHAEDWKDFADMQVPYVLERVIVADRGAAERNRGDWLTPWAPATQRAGGELRKRQEVEDGLPTWAAPFVGFSVPEGWWTPVRASLLSFLGLPLEQVKRTKPVVTYIEMEGEPYEAGPRVRSEDHPSIVNGLKKLVRDGVIGEFHAVHHNGTRENWEERMKIISKTDILLGAFGNDLADSMFLPAPLPITQSGEQPSTQAPLLIEFFTPGTFSRDREFAVRTLGMRYMAWWEDRKFSGASLPPVMGLRAGQSQWVTVFVDAVLDVIKEEAKRFR